MHHQNNNKVTRKLLFRSFEVFQIKSTWWLPDVEECVTSCRRSAPHWCRIGAEDELHSITRLGRRVALSLHGGYLRSERFREVHPRVRIKHAKIPKTSIFVECLFLGRTAPAIFLSPVGHSRYEPYKGLTHAGCFQHPTIGRFEATAWGSSTKGDFVPSKVSR